ncbi:MAG: nitrous oxide reductase family maturation protein NosD [Ignavibacteriaceae bacterium]|nr:nitrous oxide reductase family maturation protein NosD [Ignavibacteriaceae bacterium]
MKTKSLILFLLLLLTPLQAEMSGLPKAYKIRTISEAIGNAAAGDTIFIPKGTYHETKLIIDKRLVLIGVNKPEIAGNGSESLLLVRASGTIISGFIFRDAGVSFINDNAAVKVENADSVEISNNEFYNNFFAIYLANVTYSLIKKNKIRAVYQSESTSGNGIHLWKCKRISIIDNDVSGHRDGIYFEFVDDSYIKGNKSYKNSRYGLHFMFSHGCKYTANTFEENSAGVAVMFTKKVEMFANIFRNNKGTAAYGLLLKDISDSHIHGNTFDGNSVALFSEGSDRILINNNNFTGNGWAVRLMQNSYNLTFSKNNFSGNTFEVSSNSFQNNNYFSGNYWSEYKGYDLDKDGIGDIPHNPVTLFSVLVEKNSVAMLLMRSFLIEVLNITERIFPAMIPDSIKDLSPSMKEIT